MFDTSTIGLAVAIIIPTGGILWKGVSWAIQLNTRFDAHEQRDEERFEEQRETLQEIRVDLKKLLWYTVENESKHNQPNNNNN